MQKQKLYIIKIGGNVINSEEKLKRFLHSFSSIQEKKILIHGGGKIVDELSKKMGVKQEMVNGRRITDAQTLELTTMVYAGLLNKNIVALLQANGTNAIGLSGTDGNCITTKKRKDDEIDFGFVGDIMAESVNTSFFSVLMNAGIVPVVCSITHDGNGQLLNTNADTLSSALAAAFAREYEVQLNYCFEKNGVLLNPEDNDSMIDFISSEEYKSLLANKIVSEGMIPKLDNAFAAIKNGVETVVIGHADELLNAINKKQNAGTYLIA